MTTPVRPSRCASNRSAYPAEATRSVAAFALLAALVAPRVHAAEPAPSPTVPEFDQPVALAVPTLVLRCSGVDTKDLVARLKLRAPGLTVEIAGDGDRVDAPIPFAHAILHPDGEIANRWSLAVVLSNGDAYHRSFDAEPGDVERVAATTTIALLHGWTLANPQPATATAKPTVTPPPTSPTPPPSTTPPPIVRPPPPPPRHELGLAIEGGPMLGLGPPKRNDGLAAGVAALTVFARLRRGPSFAVQVRTASRTRFDYALVRAGAVARAGYTWRFDALDVALEGQLSLEKWWITRGVHSASLDTRIGAEAASQDVIGAAARVAVGRRFVRGRDALRVSGFTSLGGAGMLRGGIGNVQVRGPSGLATDAFRVGGFEWTMGLELAWSRALVRRSRSKAVTRPR